MKKLLFIAVKFCSIPVLSLWILLVPNQSYSENFTPHDIRLGDSTINYVNPEISPIGNFMIWIEIDTSNGFSGVVWHCGLNPDTGDLIPENGKGFNAFTSNVYGRPADWGVDSDGPYYVGLNSVGQFVFVRPTSSTTADVEILPTAPDRKRRVIYPSQLPDTNKRFITYILNENQPGGANNPANSSFDLRFIDLDDPTNEQIIETQSRNFPAAVGMDVLVPRWIKGTPYLTFGFYDQSRFVQVKEFNAFEPTSAPVSITNDKTIKADGYPVNNPYQETQYLISGLNGTDSAIVYRRNQPGEVFEPVETIVPETNYLQEPALNQSHEPFFFDDQLFTTFQVNDDGGSFVNTTLNEPGEIWVTSIDGSEQRMWQISQFDPSLNISEPEPFTGNNMIFVYYSANRINSDNSPLNRIFQLRRAETLMNQWETSTERVLDTKPDDITLYPNYPNPFNAGTVIRYDLTEPQTVVLSIYSIQGQLIEKINKGVQPTGLHHHFFQPNSLSTGIYYLVIDTELNRVAQKLTLIK